MVAMYKVTQTTKHHHKASVFLASKRISVGSKC